MMLTMIIDVMGMNILLRPLSIRISPGSLPNQFSNQGANWKISPKARMIEPTMMSQRVISGLIIFYAGWQGQERVAGCYGAEVIT